MRLRRGTHLRRFWAAIVHVALSKHVAELSRCDAGSYKRVRFLK